MVELSKCYLMGPMTGYPQENRPAFQRATAVLRGMGFEVISPDELDHHDPTTETAWASYMRRDIPHLLECNFGVLLSGWRRSAGATLECVILTKLGCPVFELTYEPDGQPFLRLVPEEEYPTVAVPSIRGTND